MKKQIVKFREKEFRIVASKSMNFACHWCKLKHYRCELACYAYRTQLNKNTVFPVILISAES